MQKTDLIAEVAKKTEVTQTETAKVVNAAIDAIIAALKSGDKVTLTGFGTFEVRATKARTGTNPATREKIQIPAGKRVSFSAGAVLKKEVTQKGEKKAAKKAPKKGGKK
jgi:DNA-binding protein HU-beta